jgi:hypothetical protein
MKHRLLNSTHLAAGLVLALIGGARADFNPVPLTPNSYTFDIVVERGALPAVPYCLTASQGGGTGLGDSTWFEQGFWRSPNQNFGLPHPGQTFVDQSNPNRQYTMPPDYTTNNCLLADSSVPEGGTLTLATPTTCTSLSFFGSSGGGNGTINYTVTHADSSTETGTFDFNDWFNGANPSWTALGRCGTPGGGLQNNGSNPRLYSAVITVSSASPVANVNFTYGGGGHVGIYAVSTSSDDTTYTPVIVSGFTQKVIIPATFPLTATMDQGTNTNDNGNLATWFEAGYITNNLAYGLPTSGSTFSSQSQPTHHYQMGDYSANNAVLIDAGHTSANITPASPAAYNAFALLTAGGNIGTGNRMTNLCIMEHADGVNETNTFYGYDWFEGTVPGFVAYVSAGRVNMHDRTVNAVGSGNPKLFESYFALSDTASPVTNILLRFGSAASPNATTFIMAVSATAGGLQPVILGQPQRLNTWPGTTANFGITMGAGTPPLSFNWQKAASPAGPFANLTDGGNISGATTPNLTVANVSAADQAYYQVIVANALGSATSTPPAALYLLTSTKTNITLPADAITDINFVNNIPSNGGEGVNNVINRTTQKYLCFGSGPNPGAAPFQGPVGFEVTPGLGNTIVSAMRIYTANDAVDRDPADIMLEGSNDGANWTTILADTSLSLPDERNNGGLGLNMTNQVLQEIDFPNSTGYTSYRVTINNVKTNATANGMQLAEIELLGLASGPPVVVQPHSLPENNAVLLGTTTRLSVGVGGSEPFTFQWTHAGTNVIDNGRISGSQTRNLTIANVQYTDAGYYQLNITNAQGFYNTYPGGGADQNLLVVAVPTLMTNGLGWMANASTTPVSPVIDNNILTLTYGAGSSARSAFFDSPTWIGAFKASFIYQDVAGGGADGATFCLQNDPRGPAALGGAGGGLGVSGITPSAELTFNIYDGSPGGVGISFGTNGNNGNPYQSTTPVNIAGGNPIAVTVLYRNGAYNVTLTDTVTSDTFTTNIQTGDLTAVLGGQTAYVGFTGADGGISSTQTITDFQYVPLTALSVRTSGANVVVTWPMLPAGYVLQSRADLASGNWQPVPNPVVQVGGQNQVTLPASAAKQFYRLGIPLP